MALIRKFSWSRVRVGQVLSNAWNDIMNNHIMALAAGLSYYFVLSLFPLLIMAAALVGYLPIPNLFDQILNWMAGFVPPESMALVREVVASIISPQRGGLVTFGFLGTVWVASSGVAAMIEALNVTYDVPETRPFWKTRLQAIVMTIVLGGLMVTALAFMIVGPQFGAWLAGKLHLSPVWVVIWPYLRWGASVASVVLAVEILFFWAPNVKQRFWATLPGAIIGVGAWLGLSYLLSIYFQNFANYNKTYGALGAAMALMVWLYWSSFAILIGAEINGELLKAGGAGTLELKHKPPQSVKPRPAWEEREERVA